MKKLILSAIALTIAVGVSAQGQRKTGAPDETVNVHMNLQVLYFNPNTSKK